jgi:hypothetical protein
MSAYSFQEYIVLLRENVTNLVQYREKTGTLEPSLLKIRNDLFSEDPFVVFGASMAASVMLADQTIYH